MQVKAKEARRCSARLLMGRGYRSFSRYHRQQVYVFIGALGVQLLAAGVTQRHLFCLPPPAFPYLIRQMQFN